MASVDYLRRLESRSIYILREAFAEFCPIGMLWSMGKDSTALLWLARKAFLGKVPFPIYHIDTSYKSSEMIKFRNELAQKWGLELRVVMNTEALVQGWGPDMGERWNRMECCNRLKTLALKKTVRNDALQALIVGIRRDEHAIRSRERYFSKRGFNFQWNYIRQRMELPATFDTSLEMGAHMRVHPLLDWTEIDIWSYIELENIPTVSLYFAKDGKRYRSIGCLCCCAPIDSCSSSIRAIVEEIKTNKAHERSGRMQDKEYPYNMIKLRSLGYM